MFYGCMSSLKEANLIKDDSGNIWRHNFKNPLPSVFPHWRAGRGFVKRGLLWALKRLAPFHVYKFEHM